MACITCGRAFVKKTGGYHWYGVNICVEGEFIGKVLEKFQVRAQGRHFVCYKCFCAVRNIDH